MKYRTEVSGDPLEVEVLRHEGSVWSVAVEGKEYELDLVEGHVLWGTRSLACRVIEDDHGVPTRVVVGDHEFEVYIRREGRGNARGPASRGFVRSGENQGRVTAPMNGQVVKVLHHLDDPVAKGEVVMVLEAMKMENEVISPMTGHIEAVFVKTGTTVKHGEPLFVVKPVSS